MKILHIGKYYHPYSGGMESVVKDLCEGLHQKGHDVTVLCSNVSMKKSTDVINGVKVVRLPRTGVLFGQNLNPTLFYEIHRYAKEADLVHVHCPNPLAEVLSLTLGPDTPIVTTHHSDIIRQKLILKFYRPLFKKFLSRVHKIFVPTFNHIKHSQFLPDYKEKCELIPFGIKDDFLETNESNLTFARKFRRDHGPYALFVGRLVGYKGIRVLIEAAKNLEETILIVGEGPQKAELQELILKNNLKDRVKLLGKVQNNAEFVGLYHGCEMLVLPSVTPNENFGIVQLEAMACSKPVVTTNLKSGVPAVGIKEKTCLIVEPNNPDQLFKAMFSLFKNTELKTTLGREGRKRFDNFYTWQGMVDTQIDAYRRLKEINTIIAKHRKAS